MCVCDVHAHVCACIHACGSQGYLSFLFFSFLFLGVGVAFFFETGFLCIALAVLELILYVHHHAWLRDVFLYRSLRPYSLRQVSY